jgi:hypothetical protein
MAKAKPVTITKNPKVREVQTIPLKGGLHLRPLGEGPQGPRFGIMLTSTAPVTVINADQVEQVKALEFPKSYESRLTDKIKAIRRVLIDNGVIKAKSGAAPKKEAKAK